MPRSNGPFSNEPRGGYTLYAIERTGLTLASLQLGCAMLIGIIVGLLTWLKFDWNVRASAFLWLGIALIGYALGWFFAGTKVSRPIFEITAGLLRRPGGVIVILSYLAVLTSICWVLATRSLTTILITTAGLTFAVAVMMITGD